ncbi:MAG: site-specific integrase [Candidatus Stahlbacteria bacterium]|nr:MAG: site-specific integrase [Candidatus Stahlbacteria bacterium]
MLSRRHVVGPATVNRDLALLRNMLSKAVDWEYLKENAAKKIKPYPESSGRERYLSEDEIPRLLDACRHSANPILYEIVVTALNTGMRKGELRSLTWKDVDFERRIITARETKNKTVHHAQINDLLLPTLQTLWNSKPHSDYVFSKPDGTAYGNWRRSFETTCRRAGITDFCFHDLRHTYLSYLIMSGVGIRAAKELIGHKTMKMVLRYSHLSNAHLQAAANRLGEELGKFAPALDGQSRKASNINAPVAQTDRASDF